MIKAIIFDMDGLLIDSEPFWREAEIIEFAKVGIHLTEEITMQTMGLRVNEVVDYWYKQHPWDLTENPLQTVGNRIVDHVIRFVNSEGKPLEGVSDILAFFANKSVKLALASSSDMHLIDAILDKLKIKDRFEAIHSAQFEQNGKPHPAVFLTTAERLGISPQDCLVLEDSVNGVIAAKAARMKCVAVPEAAMQGDKRFAIADAVLQSLMEFDDALWEKLNSD